MSTDTDLLPCPFCGSTNLNTEDARDFISCKECHAEGPMYTGMGMGGIQSAAAWNRRADFDAPAAQAVEPQCKCAFAQRMQGDGCDECNPARAGDLAGTTGEQHAD